jgi:Fe-S cluster assembly protein SufD
VWRYSRIDALDLDRYRPVTGDQPTDTPSQLADALTAGGARAGRVVLRNGRIVAAELAPDVAAKGVRLSALADLDDGAELLVAGRTTPDAFTELNLALSADVVVIDVPSGVTVELPIAIVHWVDAPDGAVFPRTIVRAGENAEVTVLDWIASPDISAMVAPVLDLDVAQSARVRHLGVQDLGPQVWQMAYNASHVGRDGSLLSASVAIGGDYARVRTDSTLAGQGSEAHLLAVYFGDGTQMHDFRTLQEHEAPKTTSDLLFKGAVAGSARSVYSGLIRVKKGAAGTAAFQTNRNLVLSEGAHADSVPNLEIEENDVKCSHASAVGPVDEDQRYYLESRGVPPQAAERLIVLGFFDEILARIPVASLQPLLRLAVADKLQGAMG